MLATTALLAVLLAQPVDCPACRRADSLVAAGDTSAAISVLREAAPGSGSGRLWGQLGLLLTRAAPTRDTDFEMREEARKALDRAHRLAPDDPRWYFARGLLLRKQGIRVDAERLFDRAVALQPDADEEARLTRRELAEVHAERGRLLEEKVLDFRGFVSPSDHIPVNSPECSQESGAFCRNYTRPESFHEQLLLTPPQDSLVADEAREMRREFETAFELAPELPVAARSLLGELARRGAWERFVAVARAHADTRPGDGWPWIFLGAGHFRAGDAEAARGAFAAGLERLPDGERRVLENVETIIAAEEAERLRERPGDQREQYETLLWKISDPFYLTGVNERRLEHYTRTALAEVWYGDPQGGRRGYETDRGVVLIRYGEPKWIRRIRRDEASARAAAELSAGTDFDAARSVGPGAESGGRWVFWTYREDMPSFIFEKHLTSRTVEHADQTYSAQFTEDVRGEVPSIYAVPDVRGLPHQVVRFRSDEVDVEMDVFAALPEDTAADPRTGTAGLYFLPRTADEEVVGLDSEVRFGPGARIATFRVPLDAGRYRYSVEAISDDGAIRARERGVADLADFRSEGFGLSDLMLAHRIAPPEEGTEVRSRRDLRISPAGELRFEVDAPLAVYFEIYDLRWETEEEGRPPVGSYRVRVRIVDAEDEDVVGRVVDALGGLFGGGRQGTDIEWERTVEGPRDRIPEWLALALPETEPGSYTIEVVVEDLRGGEDRSIARSFELVSS